MTGQFVKISSKVPQLGRGVLAVTELLRGSTYSTQPIDGHVELYRSLNGITAYPHNFPALDKSYQYNFRSDRIKTAKRLGFSFISQATIELYFKYRSEAIVAKKLSVSRSVIARELNKFGVKRVGLNNGLSNEMRRNLSDV